MSKILINSQGKALMNADGKVYKTEPDTSQEDGLIDGSITSYSNDSVTTVRDYGFRYLNLENVDLPNVTIIGQYAFSDCKVLKSIYIPNVTRLNASVFYNCSSLETINLPNVTTIQGSDVFRNCTNLKTVNLPNVTIMNSNYGFKDCDALIRIELPLLKDINQYMFNSCNSLTSVILGAAKSISNHAFSYCGVLTDIYLGYEGLVSLTSTNAFSSSGTTQGYINVHVRPKYASQYADATNWSSLIADGTIVIVGDYSD